MEEQEYRYEVDLNRLDGEWARHPKTYYEAALEAAEAREDYEALKADKDLTEAELDEAIRRGFEEAGAKYTEKVVANAIIRSEKYQKVMNKLLKAKHRVDVCEVNVRTLDHRKSALENAVKLRLADYFSTPTVKEGIPLPEKVRKKVKNV